MFGLRTSGLNAAARSRRYFLAIVLAVIATALVGGGGYLITLGGSPYYLIAGLTVAASAWFAWRGDERAIWIYLVMLAFTLAWAVWEGGTNPWSLQARLFAPLVLFIWVAAPWLRRLGWPWVTAGAAVIVVSFATWLFAVNRNETVAPVPASAAVGGPGDWRHYGNDLAGSRASPLTQIDAANVADLKPIWTFNTGVKVGMGFEATPLMVDGGLYLCTANNTIFALDPETGVQLWKVDPKVDMPFSGACRGVAYFRAGDGQAPCDARIIFATTDARLMAVDARTGAACAGFGADGTVDLKTGMGEVEKAYYYVSSPPVVANGKIVLGGWVMDGQKLDVPSGVIRAFDAITGQFSWAFDIDRPGQSGEPPLGRTYSRGTANSWGPMSADETLGLVYAPMGNASPDYWGGKRSPGSETYASSVVALDLATGTVRWRYQTAHHDLWDYDIGSQPTLIDLKRNGGTVPAMVLPTKRGQIFLLDRRSGQPLAAVEERPVPQGAAEGDFLSPTQPFSVGMPAFDNTLLTEALMWGATPIDQLWCRIKFREARYEGPMTPPGVKPSITYPGYLGGVDWGGVAVDPVRQLLVVNWSRVPNYTRLIPRADAKGYQPIKDGKRRSPPGTVPQIGTPFAMRTGPFLSPLQMPCTTPPFGKIGVVDLTTRKLSWQRALGTSRDSGPMNTRSLLPLPMGVPTQGGSITTGSGLVFIGASQEHAFRAFDIHSGKRLWTARLPAGGNATPMTYLGPKSGRQFVVIAAGGNMPLRSGVGDAVIAYALPSK